MRGWKTGYSSTLDFWQYGVYFPYTQRGAIILTSNRGFGEWGEVFGDTVVAAALLDRLLHHAIVVEIAGSSYRLREHAKLVPESLRLPPLSAPH